MNGVKLGENFVSAAEARDNIIGKIREIAGPIKDLDTGKRRKPDILFAIDVIKNTIPMDALVGMRLEDFQRALETLFNIRGELCLMETMIMMFWRPEEEEDEKDE